MCHIFSSLALISTSDFQLQKMMALRHPFPSASSKAKDFRFAAFAFTASGLYSCPVQWFQRRSLGAPLRRGRGQNVLGSVQFLRHCRTKNSVCRVKGVIQRCARYLNKAHTSIRSASSTITCPVGKAFHVQNGQKPSRWQSKHPRRDRLTRLVL